MRSILSLLAVLTSTVPAIAAPQAVVDTGVTGSLVQQVLGNLADVHVLLPAGASAHHHQLSPADARHLQEADLLIWTGPDLTPWLTRATNVLDSDAQQLRLLDVPDTHLINFGSTDHHAHSDEHDHDHDHGPIDPHAWLNPQNAQIWVKAIAGSLSEADPENAATYQANADGASRAIGELDAATAQKLSAIKDMHFVVFHDAYGYFTQHFGLQPAIAMSEGDASTPSAKRIAALRADLVGSGATCAFPEAGHGDKAIAVAVEGTDIQVGAPLDPEGNGHERGVTLYTQLIDDLAKTLIDCLTETR